MNRLALKITGFALPWVVLLPLVLLWITNQPIPWLTFLLVAFLGGPVIYVGAYRYLDRRMILAEMTLRQLRNRQFDNLEATRLPEGDELSSLNRQVYRTGQALRKEIEELRKMESYRREFLGNVSHELKTPIFAVQGFAETLLNGAIHDDEVNRKFLEKILHHAHRLSALTNDLGEISRIETGELQMTIAPFNLTELVREVVGSLENKATQQRITLHIRIPQQLPMVLGDRDRIQQVLVNLIDNGIKYNEPEGYVEVSAFVLGARSVKITVIDDGLGIEPEHLPRLTERFYRVDRSRSRAQGGTGLGLAIVKHILEAHGQKLVVESTPHLGSTFSFGLHAAHA